MNVNRSAIETHVAQSGCERIVIGDDFNAIRESMVWEE